MEAEWRELKDELLDRRLADMPGCVLDCFLLKSGAPCRGEASHREAVAFAMERAPLPDGETEPVWEYDAARARARRIDAARFLALPEARCGETVRREDGSAVTPCDAPTDGGVPYWRAFLEPPHGGGGTAADFRALNEALFPEGTEGLEVYAWSTDWSDYFDEGREWWGASCWSVHDPRLDRYVVIFASATD